MTRRDLMKGAALSPAMASAQPQAPEPSTSYQNFFGDLHNHNEVGYAQGTLERSFEVARNHLDFYAFTPHSYWPDVGRYDGKIEHKWLNGFIVAEARWPEVVELARKYDEPGTFATILGYERHGAAEGDYHILFPDLAGDYELIEDLAELQAFAKKRGCLMIPHHPSNRLGHRGIAAASIDPEVSPVLEIHSEWGCAEHDRAPHPYKRHTEGGRWTRHTWQRFLAEGHRLGAIASSDDHLGYPGAYREGLCAVKCKELTREAIFDALRNRRCYAVTGDRIALDFSLNGRIMGSGLPYVRERSLRIGVVGWDQVDRIELLENNRVIHREFPMDRDPGDARWSKPCTLRFEYGWGPWPALGWGGTADWDFTVEVERGRIVDAMPCFTSGPLDEFRRDRIVSREESRVRVRSYTALKQQIDDYSQKALVLRIEGDGSTRVTVTCDKPAKCALTQTLAELDDSNEMLFTRPFPWESAMLHRPVFQDNYAADFTVPLERDGAVANWYYVRVVQANGEMAWSSPIWVEAR
ncbi:MAG: DUF3604 domain-containing protein [Acidobacteria bacterium]|nr:DUF3604 domain-containing protein [Acidobacteriota bacterium]